MLTPTSFGVDEIVCMPHCPLKSSAVLVSCGMSGSVTDHDIIWSPCLYSGILVVFLCWLL